MKEYFRDCNTRVFLLTFMTFGFLILQESKGQNGYLLERIQPQVGQQGTTVTVHAIGNSLINPEQVLFYQPGIKCTGIVPAKHFPSDRDGKPQAVPANTAYDLTFEIEKNAAIGEYQLRIRTEDGLSELVTFWVTPFPVVAEKHAYVDLVSKDGRLRNDQPEFAQAIELNTTVYGYVANYATQDHDWYSVSCKKGQRLSVEVIASQLGFLHYGGMNDPSISIHDEDGKRLARNDDNAFHGQDPVVSLTVPHDGTYYIQMKQQMDYENRLRHYLLHVGTFARPTLTFPLGGKTGTRTKFRFLGDGKGTFQRNINLPKQVSDFEGSYLNLYTKSPSEPVAASPNTIHLSPFENIREQDEKSTFDSPQSISQSLPFNIDGWIESEGEVDWYRFRARKGVRYRVRTYGTTLDSELDPKVWIKPAPNNPSKREWDVDDTLWDAHDWIGHPYRWQVKDRLDPIFLFEPDHTGDWLIGITDTRREFSSHHIYRIEFQPHQESAFVHFPAYPFSTNHCPRQNRSLQG